MKLLHLLVVFTMIATIAISTGVTVVHAQTITKDFGEQSAYDLHGYEMYSYDVTARAQQP